MKKWFRKKSNDQQENDQPFSPETVSEQEELEVLEEFEEFEETIDVEDSEDTMESEFTFSAEEVEEEEREPVGERSARKRRWFRWGKGKQESEDAPAFPEEELSEEELIEAQLTEEGVEQFPEIEAEAFEDSEEYIEDSEFFFKSSAEEYVEAEEIGAEPEPEEISEREHKRFGWFKKGKREEQEPEETTAEETFAEESFVEENIDEETFIEPVLEEVREVQEDTSGTTYADEAFAVEEPASKKKRGFFARLKRGLEKTRKSFLNGLDVLVAGRKVIDEDLLEELEELLITSDIGVKTTLELIKRIQKKVDRNELEDPAALKSYLEREISKLMDIDVAPLDWSHKPLVIMVIGVNGTGKTTTIGKLASHFQEKGKKVLMVAADTFRAAAIEQLEVWSNRVGCQLIKNRSGSDPSAVAFDGVKAAQSRNVDVVIIDTAGRLHTKVNLMEELKKMRRVIGGQIEDAPHETLLVLDATTGQNALSQARIFNDTIGVNGLILTKLDGTAKGGIVLAITQELNIPVRYIGVGEAIEDLREFNPRDFASAMFES